VHLAEERCNREKDSRKFPALSTQACMDELEIAAITDFDLVVVDYIGRPDWRIDQFRAPCLTDTFLSQIEPDRLHVVNHHLAHCCNVFYSSGFESAAVLVVDGRGSNKETQSLFLATPNGIDLIESTATIGIGLLYAAVTQAIGFALLQEGKTMGLAPYGAAVKEQVFTFPHAYNGISTDYSSVCIEDSYDLSTAHRPLVSFEDKARAAYEVQKETESALLHLAQYTFEKTGASHLCFSGGVALNSVANHRILRSGIFKGIYINPDASDAGIPLGAALHGYHTLLKRKKTYSEISAYLGPRYQPGRISDAIGTYRDNRVDQKPHQRFRIVDQDILSLVGELLAANKIIGCFQGRSDRGPRALGNRSILMSPLQAENKDVLNSEVKHREAFRPFAPVILEEFAQEYFDIDRPSPYMLLVPPVREEKRKVIPAVTHIDGTGRLQTVSDASNPHLYAIVEQFYQRTGVPVLLNTSFNMSREPIVETPEDALRCFMGTKIDALLIGDRLLVKEHLDEATSKSFLKMNKSGVLY